MVVLNNGDRQLNYSGIDTAFGVEESRWRVQVLSVCRSDPIWGLGLGLRGAGCGGQYDLQPDTGICRTVEEFPAFLERVFLIFLPSSA